MHLPKISVVTPSFNQGHFIEDTILSVLNQSYQNLEYIIIDGGSTDGTTQIVEKYGPQLEYWVSEQDSGQSNAINKGFSKAEGDILAWINSDDYYLPGTLRFVADQLKTGEREILFGNCVHLFDGNGLLGSDVVSAFNCCDLRLVDFIIQPSSFWTREAWEANGPLNERLTYAFDWEWFLRAQAKGIPLRAVGRYLSVYRKHKDHKTGVGGRRRAEEVARLFEEYEGRKVANLYLYLYDKGDSVRAFRRRIRRFHLTRMERFLFKWAYPGTRKFSWGVLNQILRWI
jgi:glycosyltransferase involved in cell wall biosynthesis